MKKLNMRFEKVRRSAAQKRLLVITVMLLVFGLSACGEAEIAQTNTNEPVSNAASRPAGYDGPFQADIFTKGRDTFKRGGDINSSISEAKLEEIWFRFPADGNTMALEIEVPAAGMEYLNKYFRGALKHRLVETKGAQEQVDADLALAGAAEAARSALWEIPINAPDGKRNISQAEADKLITFVIRKADEIKLEIDSYK